MKLPRKLITAARRRAFPWHRKAPKGATGAVEAALRFVLDGRADGATGPAIYRRFMDVYLARLPRCPLPHCWHCETNVARGQRVILSALEAIAELERPGT
jgi:hypothetical protein